MALLSPSIDCTRHDAGIYREVDVLERLKLSLPDDFELFHSVDWHSLQGADDRHGEVDIVVLAPTGNTLLVEVKAGALFHRNGELLKLYGAQEKKVDQQSRVQYAAVVSKLTKAGIHSHVTNCLVLPDFQVGPSEVVNYPRERIIDATDYDVLGTRVREIISQGQSRSSFESIRRFFSNEFSVTSDLRVFSQQLKEVRQRLSEGLATWVPRITSPSGVVRIQATAGSGKTQLALRLLGDAAEKQEKALYVCYNRPLADHISQMAPVRAKVASFHELCVDFYRAKCGEPQFDNAQSFAEIVANYCTAAVDLGQTFDLIIVDEAQDFELDWIGAILPQLKDNGRLYVLEDNAQRLYDRHEAFELSGAVSLECQDNFRSPRQICNVINALSLTDQPVSARSPYEGDLPGFHVYESASGLKRQTENAVQALLDKGIPLEDIAILTLHGLGHSALLQEERLGNWPLRKFTGKYDRNGNQEWTKGDLLIETVYRFKGQSAGGVVLTEVDFDALDERTRNKLFVGLTRGHLAVEIVLSKGAENCLATALDW